MVPFLRPMRRIVAAVSARCASVLAAIEICGEAEREVGRKRLARRRLRERRLADAGHEFESYLQGAAAHEAPSSEPSVRWTGDSSSPIVCGVGRAMRRA